MKQFFTKFMLIGMVPLAGYGQTIVSTQQENRKAILEEFTGIHCVYCPQGHAIAEQIINSHPGDAFAINIHEGGYATPASGEPDFRTPFGTAIANQTGLTGYPAGTVNRHNFPGFEMGNSGTTAMGRGEWTAAANQIMALPSYLNMAAEATIDVNTRELTVHVESYYTGSSPAGTNFLNVALLQNNTKGPQTGGNAGNNYVHKRRLVNLLTGQWGEEISTTTQGSFVDKTYTYTIPADYNGIPADISEMQIVVFMTQTHQEIISGNGTYPTYLGLANSNDLAINTLQEYGSQCAGTIAPTIQIQNRGQNNITSAEIEYTINGEAHSYTWTGDLGTYEKADIALPEVSYSVQPENTLTVSVASDDNNDNNSMSTTFNKAVEATTTLHLTVQTDAYGSETRWNIKNSAGTTVQQQLSHASNHTYETDIELPASDCYTFNLIDTYGDGGAHVTLKDSNDVTIYQTTGNYGAGASTNFQAGLMAVSDVEANMVSVYPNPSNGIINISSKSANNNVEVYDVTGKRIYSTKTNSTLSTIDLSSYGKGVFVVKISDGKTVTNKKVIIK